MSALVIDAEAVSEFLDKAEPLVGENDIGRWNQVLALRARTVPDVLRDDRRCLLAVPATARLGEEARRIWDGCKGPLREDILWHPHDAIAELASMAAPPWLWDWATFWLGAVWPGDFVWWPRWMFLPQSQTGAVALVLADPACLVVDTRQLYTQIGQAARFTEQVMESLHRIPQVEPPYRHLVALAMVYTVYLFTMTSWRLTEEFTHVLPPFPKVVTSLLGIRRWEDYGVAKGESN